MGHEPRYAPRSIEAPARIQAAARVNRIRQGIGELEALRETVASNEPITFFIPGFAGTGKSVLTSYHALLALSQENWWRNPLHDVLRAGSVVPTTNWLTGAGATLEDGTVATLGTLLAAIRAPHTPRTPAELIPSYRPVGQWLSLAEIDGGNPPSTGEASQGAARTAGGLRPSSSSSILRAVTVLYGAMHGSLAGLYEPQPVTLFDYLDRLERLREHLLQRIDRCLTALRLALRLVLAACAHCPDVRSFVLVIVATSRHYGHRSEPDDHALPAHRWISVIGGEPALSC